MPIFQNPNVRKQAGKAAQGGQLSAFLQSHPEAMQRFNQAEGTKKGAAQAGKLGAVNQQAGAQAPPGSGGAPGNPKTPGAGSTTKSATAPATTPAAGAPPKTPGAGSTPPAAAAPAPPTFGNFLDTEFGAGNPFGMQSWYGDNPLQTAKDAANQNLGTNLAGIRANYGQQGLGSSSREALAEGTATAQTNTQLGSQLAQLGQQAHGQDASTALNATLGAGALNNQATAQLANQGAGITGIGTGEQNIPGIGSLLSLISAFQTTIGSGTQGQSGSSTKA